MLMAAARLTARRSSGTVAGMSWVECAGLLLLTVLAGCVSTEPFRDAERNTLPDSVAVMQTLPIDGVSQMVWFRGSDVGHPALILLHGGLGASEAALFHHCDADLELGRWVERSAASSTPTCRKERYLGLRCTDEASLVDFVQFWRGNAFSLAALHHESENVALDEWCTSFECRSTFCWGDST